MQFKIIFSIIISLIIIIILHNIFIFFKNNLTAPKIKDFIEKPSKDYEDIYKIINYTILFIILPGMYIPY